MRLRFGSVRTPPAIRSPVPPPQSSVCSVCGCETGAGRTRPRTWSRWRHSWAPPRRRAGERRVRDRGYRTSRRHLSDCPESLDGSGSGVNRCWWRGPGGCEGGRRGSPEVPWHCRWGRLRDRADRRGEGRTTPRCLGGKWSGSPAWSRVDSLSRSLFGTGRSRDYTLQEREKKDSNQTLKAVMSNVCFPLKANLPIKT